MQSTAAQENARRIQAWIDSKVTEWHKGGRLRTKFPDINDLRVWMAGQIQKAHEKQSRTQDPLTASGVDTDGKTYKNLDELWATFAAQRRARDAAAAQASTTPKAGGKGAAAAGPAQPAAQTQSRLDWYRHGHQYWNKTAATLQGVLGGFAHVSPLDITESKAFLDELKVSKGRSVDLGAGIGRITKDLLIPYGFKQVDLVEQSSHYVEAARGALQPVKGMGKFYTVGLQDYSPPKGAYDVMWFQWVLGHLPDDDLIAMFDRCREGLAPGGYIIVKENVSRGSGFVLDKEDMSVTRSLAQLKRCFAAAGYKVVREERQKKFPQQLFPVRMFALVSAKR